MLTLKRPSNAWPPFATSSSPSFVSELLDKIRCGTVYLRVPLEGGVIQVGARDAPETGTIRVRKRLRTVSIERTDGKPIQVAIVHQPARSPRHYALTASLVFHRPVQTLRLKRCSDANSGRGWRVDGKPGIGDPRHIKQFVDTIGTFGTAKQRRRQGGNSLRAIWRRLSR